MKTRLSIFILSLVVSMGAAGQTIGGGFYGPTRTVRNVAADPATCSPFAGNIVLNTTTDLLKVCTAVNTWSALASLVGGTFTGPVLLPDGAAAAPSLAFSSDSDGTGTGIFRSAANSIGFTTNGVERWLINASGALNPATSATYDIGGSTTIRDIGIGRNAVFSGSTSGTTTLHSAAVAGTADITLPTGTNTLATLAGTEIFTNKTLTTPSINDLRGVSRITGANTLAPTLTTSGFGAGESATFGTGSGDAAGMITVAAGAAAAATGTWVLTFSTASAYGNTNVVPICQLGGTAVVWNARATCHVTANSTTAVTFTWDNNGVALSSGTNYRLHYWIVGR